MTNVSFRVNGGRVFPKNKLPLLPLDWTLVRLFLVLLVDFDRLGGQSTADDGIQTAAVG
jgi:hypothetical protein